MRGDKVVKVWVTTYALTRGVEVWDCLAGNREGYVHYKPPGRGFWTILRMGHEAFYTEEEALADAKKRLASKLVKTRNLLARLEKLKIKVVDLTEEKQDV